MGGGVNPKLLAERILERLDSKEWFVAESLDSDYDDISHVNRKELVEEIIAVLVESEVVG